MSTGVSFKKTSFWQLNDAWRARHSEVNDQFMQASSAAASAFGTAQVNLVNGTTAITGQIVTNRMRQDAIKKAMASVNKLA
jgi:hypothetical protein